VICDAQWNKVQMTKSKYQIKSKIPMAKCFPLTAGLKIKSKIPDFERGKAIPPWLD
jgi:hypothetical protein